jgi:serine protein kinase
VIIGHTNEPEYKKLLNNEFMEALRDRTIKIDIPYITQADRRDEDLREGLQRRGQGQAHRAAHLEMAAMWAC